MGFGHILDRSFFFCIPALDWRSLHKIRSYIAARESRRCIEHIQNTRSVFKQTYLCAFYLKFLSFYDLPLKIMHVLTLYICHLK